VERIVEQTLLYDFYGELLNEHQRGVYEDAVFNDLSLSEIADEYGISRQGVHDLIKRVSNTLEGYESKLHLVEKFMDTKAKITRIDELVDSYIKDEDMSYIHEIKKLSKEIIEDY
jgi:predicted DNA-binding protein YlxM (UPF0122 family)